MGTRLLICGDRNWTDEEPIRELITQVKRDGLAVVIHGCARGADTIAGRVAEQLGVPVLPFPAHWGRYGKAAGVLRNQQMLTEGKPTLVWGFHNDIRNSRGTRDMLIRAHKAGIETHIYPEQDWLT